MSVRGQMAVVKKGIALASLGSLLACGSGRIQSCGSSPNAILRSESLAGEESGLLGGFIQLQNGYKCTVVLDVQGSDDTNSKFVMNAWTSKHCLLEVNPGDKASFDLQIYMEGGYAKTRAWPLESLSVMDAASRLTSGQQHALKMGFDAFSRDASIIKDDKNRVGAQKECVEGGLDDDFCASVADTVVYSLGISRNKKDAESSLVYNVLWLAQDRRDEIRQSAQGVTGLTRASADFSELLTEYWRTRAHIRLSPMVDLWSICSSERLKAEYADLGRNLPAESLSSQPSGADAKWPVEVDLRPFWTRASPEQMLADCSDASKLKDIFEIVDLYRHQSGENVWKVLADIGLRDGEQPTSDAPLFGFAKAMIKREAELRETIMSDWASLSRELFVGPRPPLYLHTNVVPEKKGNLDPKGENLDAWQYSNIALDGPLFGGLRSTPLQTGVRFSGARELPLTFKAGDSGSLFTFQGQFPLVTLNSVEGRGTSGGASVTPLPNASGGAGQMGDVLDDELGGDDPTNDVDFEQSLLRDSHSDKNSLGARTSAPVKGAKTAQATPSRVEAACY